MLSYDDVLAHKCRGVGLHIPDAHIQTGVKQKNPRRFASGVLVEVLAGVVGLSVVAGGGGIEA